MFTIDQAHEYAVRGQLAAWVDGFLRGPGRNAALADGLALRQRWWIGPLELPLCRLSRCCGPEPTMEFHEPEARWSERIEVMRAAIVAGWEPPPVIAEHRSGLLSVRDGSHRVAALEVAARATCWVLVWFNREHEHLAL
jgi:hypothetical protein